ncbi:hypothetical protein IOK49_01570 [Fervidicoccus fontis]|uniref:Uncharacterized protein n=1 Tax=Fervidicoccus fontis TaxID=683846 RepID=A0A843A9L9_9CREN|nr:hypothetical protein [Fervidicoccus fontis]MBE9390774.1 hypothetical protein [Fervidicoccus fontis]
MAKKIFSKGSLSILISILLLILLTGFASYLYQLTSSSQTPQNTSGGSSSVQQSLENALRTISDLQQKLFYYNSSLSQLNQTYIETIAQLQQMNQNLTSTIEILNSSLASCNGNLSSLNETYSSLLSSYSQLMNEYSSLNASYSSLKANYSQLLTKMSELNERYSYAISELSSLNTSYANLLSQLSTISQLSFERGNPGAQLEAFFDYNSPAVISAMRSAVGNETTPYIGLYRLYNYVERSIRLNYDTPFLVVNQCGGSASFYLRELYFENATEVLNNGYGDAKDQALLLSTLYASYLSNYLNTSMPPIYMVLLNGTGYSKYPYWGFTLIIEGSGKVSLLDPAAAELAGINYQEFVQVDASEAYSAVTSYINRLNSLGLVYPNVVCMVGPTGFYWVNGTINDFLGLLYKLYG